MKIKLTKGELKRQRDALKRFERFLPTLQLKKQQLQAEILQQAAKLDEKRHIFSKKVAQLKAWVGLLVESKINIKDFVKIKHVVNEERNIAGINIPTFIRAEFDTKEYDLFCFPLWLDGAIEIFKDIFSFQEEIKVIEEDLHILKKELRIATQRVNLFEKVKIPQAQEAIRQIKIYIGDQMANAVGISKIAKKKIEEGELVLV